MLSINTMFYFKESFTVRMYTSGDRITEPNEMVDEIEGPKVFVIKKIKPAKINTFINQRP